MAEGVLLDVRLTPKSSKDAVEGVIDYDGRRVLAVRVRAKPVEGEANAALIALIASWLDVAKRRISLDSGSRSRVKTLHISGEAAELLDRISWHLDHMD